MKEGLHMKGGGGGGDGGRERLCPAPWDPAAVYIIHRSSRFIQGDFTSLIIYMPSPMNY